MLRAAAFDKFSQRLIILACGVAFLSGDRNGCHAADHVQIIRVGMSTALSGQTAELGTQVRAGVQAAFDEYNRTNQRRHKIELFALDDGYEPKRTGPNMRKLINEFNVVAVLGNVGAPCAVTAVPIANETKTPLIGYVTGGAVLRKIPPDRYVINYRASLAEEATALVEGFLSAGIKPQEIAFFTQRDSFGDSFFAGGIEALKRHGVSDALTVVHVRYERNTLAVQHALSEMLLSSQPIKAVAIGSAGLPAAEFIREARKTGMNLLFGAVSFVEAKNLAQVLGEEGNGVAVVQVVPHMNSEVPLVQQFRHSPAGDQGFIALEGFIVGNLFCRALSSIEGQVERESVTDALLNLKQFDLGLGVKLELNAAEHQACHTLWPTVLQNGEVLEFDWKSLARTRRLP